MRYYLLATLLAPLFCLGQNDDCTILGIQELSVLYGELNESADSTLLTLEAIANALDQNDTLHLRVESDEYMSHAGFIIQDSTISYLQDGQCFTPDLIEIPDNHFARIESIFPLSSWRINGLSHTFTLNGSNSSNATVPRPMFNQEIWLGPGETIGWFRCDSQNGYGAPGPWSCRIVLKLFEVRE